MLKWLSNLLFGKSLTDHLRETKVVRVSGVRFKIRKVNMMNYLEGSSVLLKYYETYKSGVATAVDQTSQKKVNEHLAQVLVAGVVEPKLSFKDGEGQNVYELFSEMAMVGGLYNEILSFAYGKKKVPDFNSPEKS